jgi:putative addiction module CopG family antidote
VKLSVSFSPHLRDFILRAVAAGEYPSASEAVLAALRLLEQRNNVRTAQGERLRHAIQKGLDSGTGTPLDVAEIKQLGRVRRAAL